MDVELKHVRVLGRGGYGHVALVEHSGYGLYAKKTSPIHLRENLEKELRIMQRFRNHSRIVQASSEHVHLGTDTQGCYIYMEYASKGSLHDMISQFRGRPMPENIIGRVALMILQGLKDLHSHGYVHGDLKPANVLVFPSKAVGELWELKLADFGISKEPSTDSRSLFGGTREYMPWELLIRNEKIGPAVDVWSLGCVVLEMFGGCPVKVGACYSWRLPKLISPLAEDFLRGCLELQPSRRATATELLNHPFVRQKLVRVPPQTKMVPCPSFNNMMGESFRRQGDPVIMMLPRPGGLMC